MTKTIFVVDDNDVNLSMANEALKGQYRVLTLPSAGKMFMMMNKFVPDLILLDIKMPGIDGFEALRCLKENKAYADVPVVFLTGMTDASVEVRGFQMGAIDFITKPFSAPVLLNRIKTHLDIDELIRERTAELRQTTEQLEKLQNGVVFVLADMVENRDKGTGGHVERTSIYLQILVDAMKVHGKHAKELEDEDIDLLISSARLHDVGKIAVPDSILNKPGKLTHGEYTEIKTHAEEGERIIDQIVSRTDNVVFLHNAKTFAGAHHERWDGTGYPRGLAGKDIPLQGRVMAIVDVYDALISERPYKDAYPHDEAVRIIMEGAGTHFDPELADIFYAVKDEFETVSKAEDAEEDGE